MSRIVLSWNNPTNDTFAGVLAAGLPIRVVHPVELLDESYRAAGLYAGG